MPRLPAGPSAHEQLTQCRPQTGQSSPLPAPSGPAPYHLHLNEVLRTTEIAAIRRARELRFHCVGDTGGHHNPAPQRAVVAAMATELAGAATGQSSSTTGRHRLPQRRARELRRTVRRALRAIHGADPGGRGKSRRRVWPRAVMRHQLEGVRRAVLRAGRAGGPVRSPAGPASAERLLDTRATTG